MADRKGTDHTAWICRLIYAFVVHIWHKQLFLWWGSYKMMCVWHRLSSACLSVQSAQSFCCHHHEALGSCLPICALWRLVNLRRYADWSESLLSLLVILQILIFPILVKLLHKHRHSILCHLTFMFQQLFSCCIIFSCYKFFPLNPLKIFLSYDIVSESVIKPCVKDDNQLVD